MLKLLKCQKILKNQKIHYLEIIEKKNVYITTQQRNIRKRQVTLKKKKKSMAITVEIFPTI